MDVALAVSANTPRQRRQPNGLEYCIHLVRLRLPLLAETANATPQNQGCFIATRAVAFWRQRSEH